jgi:hypothetical protein
MCAAPPSPRRAGVPPWLPSCCSPGVAELHPPTTHGPGTASAGAAEEGGRVPLSHRVVQVANEDIGIDDDRYGARVEFVSAAFASNYPSLAEGGTCMGSCDSRALVRIGT